MAKAAAISEEEVKALEKAFEVLMMQRSSYDQHEGTDRDVIDDGEKVIRNLNIRLGNGTLSNVPLFRE